MAFEKEKLFKAQGMPKLEACNDARISTMLKRICITLGVPKSKMYGHDGDLEEMGEFYTQVRNLPYTPDYIEMAFSYAVMGKFKSQLTLYDKQISVAFISDVVRAFYVWYAKFIPQEKTEDKVYLKTPPEKIRKTAAKTLLDFEIFRRANPKEKTFDSPIGLKIYQIIYHYLLDFEAVNISESKFEHKKEEFTEMERFSEAQRLEKGTIIKQSKDLHEAKKEVAAIKQFLSMKADGNNPYEARIKNKTCRYFVNEFFDDLIDSGMTLTDLIEI